MSTAGIRVGVDVGGTFTKAVAVSTSPLTLLAHAVVPTSHTAAGGVCEGVADALRTLLSDLGEQRGRVELVAYSTTQAMNALLEGDVGLVGVVGIGAQPDLRKARKRTQVGSVRLAAGRELRTEHRFLDVTHGLDAAAMARGLDELQAAGATAIAVSGAFSVDDAEHERAVCAAARERGMPACAGHELTGTYGLETRTISAAINASILPVVAKTATIVRDELHGAGIDVPLLVLRGDGGAMSLEGFRNAPSLTIGSGPAAGVAATLHQLQLTDAIVLECGGTSSNVSIVKHGRTVLRTLRVMGRPTAIRSVDSWVVGAAGGSMARLGRKRLEETGPRSAHVAGLPYASYASSPELFAGAQLVTIAPRPGDPEDFAVIVTAAGQRHALTSTCAAYALGATVAPDGATAVALAAFAPLAARLKTTPEGAAKALLDGAVRKIAEAVADAAKSHDFGPEVPIVALGGSGLALAPHVAQLLGRPLLTPEHPEILSSIGAALSLVRAEVVRSASGTTGENIVLAREAERACVEAGAAPQTVTVETTFDAAENTIRAVATGAAALESGAASREHADEATQLHAAATALSIAPERLSLLAQTDYFRVYSENGDGPVAVVDGLGSVPLAERAKQVVHAPAGQLLEQLRTALSASTLSLGVAELLPRVAVICGAHIVDLSDARRAEDIISGAAAVLDGHDGAAVAVLWS